jgi:DNA repair protein RecN (Recombination protein N)
MIKSLQIRNYALIEALDIQFPTGLTIITGETGAGKSILLGALGLILGERADTKALYDPTNKCIIEGRFDIAAYELEPFFQEADLDYEPELLIRREITPSGKSRAFVNDTPTNLKVLQRLSAALIDLHQQFDTLDIHQMGFQLRLLDALAGNQQNLLQYQQAYRTYQQNQQRLTKLRGEQAGAMRELEFLRFQLTELHAAELIPGEQQGLETELSSLSHAEETKRVSNEAFQFLCETDPSILSQLQLLSQSLAESAKVDPKMQELRERLLGLIAETEDIGAELERHAEATEYDPERIQELQARIDLLYRLEKKHQVTTVDELLQIQATLESQVSAYASMDDEIEQLTQAVAGQEEQLRKLALRLRKKRQGVAPDFARQVGQTLAELSMPAAQLAVDFRPAAALQPTGLDDIQFLFSANKGSAPKPIKEVASGGELSRLTLVTKSLVASAMALPTLIFDEIDAGVSGDVALKMGHILRELSDHHQVIVITHSPQVAARADEHLFIYKKEVDERTTTKVRVLDTDERVRAIATMLSKSPPSDSALENAKELIGA